MKRIIVGLLLFLCVVATSWALLPEEFFRVHDYTHAARISEMTRAIADGHFPVRWSQNLGYGYGMPLFNFYAPLPYYVGSFFYGSGLDIVLSIKLLFVISNVLVVLGSYKLGRLYFGHSGALLLAVLVALSPYRALNLYVRGALSESWALSFLPWILYYAVLVIRGVNKSWLAFAVSVAGLALTHNITLILAFPIVALFVVIEWLRLKTIDRKWHWQRVMQLALGGLLAMCLAAFYLFPAFVEKGFTQVDDFILDYYFSYQLHFLYIRQFFDHTWGFGGSGWGPQDDISFGLGIGQLLAIGLTGIVATVTTVQMLKKSMRIRIDRYRWFWLLAASALCAAISLLMTLEKTLLIWQSIPILKYAQFPWRWLTVATPFVGLVGVIGTQLLPKKGLRYVAVFGLMIITFYINTGIFRPEKYLEKASDYYSTDAQGIRQGMSSILPDYMPKGISKKITSATSLIVNELSNADTYSVVTERTHQKLISTKLTQPTDLEFAVAEYPGWTLEVDGLEQPKTISQQGLIVAHVPAGEHMVGLYLKPTSIQFWSQVISVSAVVAALAGLIWTTPRSKVKEVSS